MRKTRRQEKENRGARAQPCRKQNEKGDRSSERIGHTEKEVPALSALTLVSRGLASSRTMSLWSVCTIGP